MNAHNEFNPLQAALDRAKCNPFVAALPAQLSPIALAEQLQCNLITSKHLECIPMHDRPMLLNMYKKTFVPTAQGLSIALSLQQMIHNGYVQRDPSLESSRRFIYQGGQLKGCKLSETEWWPSFASGMVIDGITGLGKSQLIDRFLSLYQQTIEHGPNEACGWRSLKQLCWLKIHMPSDGSRGGFLEGAFRELDTALNTNYCDQYSGRSWTVEKRLVVFLHLLAVHRCGLLIIEEAQEQNLSRSDFNRDFMTFFLRLLNWGTPTVLIGNPLAFNNLKEFSQDVDRFTEAGWYHLFPVADPNSEEWLNDWIPSLWEPTLLDQSDAQYTPFSNDPHDQTLAGFVWKRTGGIPRYLARLRMEVQETALRIGIQQVNAELVDAVYRSSPKMIALHGRIEAFVRKDWRALKRFSDIPWNDFRMMWEKPSALEEQPIQPSTVSPQSNHHNQSPIKRASPRKPRSTKDNAIPKDKLTPEEIKKRSFQDQLIENMTKASGFSTE